MIIFRCDICKKNTVNLKSIVLHKKSIDYCPECERKAENIKSRFEKIIKQENVQYESRLRNAEQNFYYNELKKYE